MIVKHIMTLHFGHWVYACDIILITRGNWWLYTSVIFCWPIFVGKYHHERSGGIPFWSKQDRKGRHRSFLCKAARLRIDRILVMWLNNNPPSRVTIPQSSPIFLLWYVHHSESWVVYGIVSSFNHQIVGKSHNVMTSFHDVFLCRSVGFPKRYHHVLSM